MATKRNKPIFCIMKQTEKRFKKQGITRRDVHEAIESVKNGNKETAIKESEGN
jgi:uroporphyrinogen-III synthase